MMIAFRTGNILEAQADALVNTVNCVGIMGRGIALQFKDMFPENFKDYAAACARHEVQPGRMFVTETGELNPRFIINFPTKRHWKGKSRIEDIESGLVDLVRVIRKFAIRSIAIPPLGAGLGGLSWSEVRPRIVAALENLPDVEVVIFEPNGAPDAAALARNKKIPTMTTAKASLVMLLQQYLNGLMDPFVTLLEAHKLMFFMQEAGQDLRLNYKKAPYGPYAENLRHVLTSVEGHLISGYSDGGDDPTKRLEIVPGAFEDADRFLSDDLVAARRLDRVAELVDGFETPFGLELLATVYWVVTNEGARTVPAIGAAVRGWHPRKKIFHDDHIVVATKALSARGWIDAGVGRGQERTTKPLAIAVEAGF